MSRSRPSRDVPDFRDADGRTARLRRRREPSRRWAAPSRVHQGIQAGADGRTREGSGLRVRPHPAEMAELLIAETLRDPGAIEIGYKKVCAGRWALEEQPAIDGQAGMKLERTGVSSHGRGGKHRFRNHGGFGCRFGRNVLSTRSRSRAGSGQPRPEALQRPTKKNLKRDLFARIQARGERATPALVEKELAALEREQAALNAIEAVRAAGGTRSLFQRESHRRGQLSRK